MSVVPLTATKLFGRREMTLWADMRHLAPQKGSLRKQVNCCATRLNNQLTRSISLR